MSLPTISKAQYDAMMTLYYAQAKYPYIYGAKGPFAFDCSGLVTFVLNKIGMPFPQGTYAQEREGIQVPLNEAQPGDLIFFDTSSTPGSDHVGIVVGNGRMFNAQNENAGIQETSYLSEYWKSRITQVRRVFTVDNTTPPANNGGIDTAPEQGKEPNTITPPTSGIENKLPPILQQMIQANGISKFLLDPERIIVVGLGCVFIIMGMMVLVREPAVNITAGAITGGPTGAALATTNEVTKVAKRSIGKRRVA